MKKRKIHKAKEVFKIKNQIYKVAPYANDVDVKIDKTDNGKFESLIRVHIPPKKSLIAVKKDKCLKVSLEKSRQAIIKQVKKVKEKKKSKRPTRIIVEEAA